MQKIFRSVWVLATNGFVVGLTIVRLSAAMSSLGSWKTLQLWIEIILEILAPIAGIVLQVVGWKFAKRVNIGCLSLVASFWLLVTILWRSNPYFGVALIISVVMAILAGLTLLVYRATEEVAEPFG